MAHPHHLDDQGLLLDRVDDPEIPYAQPVLARQRALQRLRARRKGNIG